MNMFKIAGQVTGRRNSELYEMWERVYARHLDVMQEIAESMLEMDLDTSSFRRFVYQNSGRTHLHKVKEMEFLLRPSPPQFLTDYSACGIVNCQGQSDLEL